MLGKGTRTLGPGLALVAALAVAPSCGSDEEKPSEGDAKALCEAACDALNNCEQGCKPAEFVDPCTQAIAGGDAARKAEVECIKGAACEAIPSCMGNTDRCAGVSCQDPQQCDPDTGTCRDSECRPRVQGEECTGDLFCLVAFCKEAYPRTYVFTFKDVQIPLTKPMSTDAWDEEITSHDPDIYARVDRNDKQVARSNTLTDTLTSKNFNTQVEGGAKLEVQINEGDKVVFGFWDEDAGVDEYILGCSIDNPDTPEDEFPGSLRGSGVNCRDQDGNGFLVEIDPK